MSVAEWLAELGGVARRSALLRLVTRAEIEAAVAAGDIMRDARGRFALPQADEAVRAAARLGGVLSLTSAALRHGWAVAVLPDRPHVTVSRGRRVVVPGEVQLHRGELSPHQVDGYATSVDYTLEQCLRHLPFTEALCVADSALREGVGRSLLEKIADSARGPGSPQVRRVVSMADGRAANPFESTLRGISRDVPGLQLEPQVWITDGDFVVRPDQGRVSQVHGLLRAAPWAPRGVVVGRRCWRIASLLRLASHPTDATLATAETRESRPGRRAASHRGRGRLVLGRGRVAA